MPSVDGCKLFEPGERDGKGKSLVRCVEGGSSQLWRMRDVMPDIIGRDKEKLKRAFNTISEVVIITRVHAPFFKRLTTSSITRLRAYIAPINGELQGPFSLAVSEDHDTRDMTVRGRVMLREARVQNPELTQTYTHDSIHGKRAAWILE